VGVLISADELAGLQAAGAPVTVLDVRWTLGGPDGRPLHREGHIPGAVYVDLHHELADPSLPAAHGRHPLPPVERLQESARAWGVTAGRPVVVYDDNAGMSAARAWWLLRHAGVDDTHLSAISLTGADRPSWYVTLDDVRIGNQSWIADLAGVAVTRPGELPPARGLEGDSLMRAANFAKAMRSVARAGRRLGHLRVEPQRVDADVKGRDGLRSVRVDAAQRVTVDDRLGSLPATIAVSRVPAGALERAVETIARRGVPARRVDYAVLSLSPGFTGVPSGWTIFYERVSASRRTWRASLDGRSVERVG